MSTTNKCLKTQGNSQETGLNNMPGLEAVGIETYEINIKGSCKASDFQKNNKKVNEFTVNDIFFQAGVDRL